MSSSYYIINDLADIKKDQNHPEKKNRPLASGKISKLSALVISMILFNISLTIAYFLSVYFTISLLSLFILSQAYTFFLKKIAFLDIISISINFVIRAISGTFIINEPVSPWVILSTFFLSAFLVSTKRSLEVSSDYKDYRSNFNQSDKKVLEYLSIIAITSVFIFFSIYSILVNKSLLLLSLPIALYIILNFLSTISSSPEKIRNPERFIFSPENLIALFLCLIVIVITFYII
jgi:4-hydroxybenzoate polyprenyltransferase